MEFGLHTVTGKRSNKYKKNRIKNERIGLNIQHKYPVMKQFSLVTDRQSDKLTYWSKTQTFPHLQYPLHMQLSVVCLPDSLLLSHCTHRSNKRNCNVSSVNKQTNAGTHTSDTPHLNYISRQIG